MWTLVNLAMLVFATLIAGAAAVAVYWLLLRATVEMMRPAAVRSRSAQLSVRQATAGQSQQLSPRGDE